MRARDLTFDVKRTGDHLYYARRPAAAAAALHDFVATADAVSFQWFDSPSSDVVNYRVSYGFAPGDNNGSGAHQGDSPIDVGLGKAIVLSGLTEGSSYYVRVSAVDGAGKEASRRASSSACRSR